MQWNLEVTEDLLGLELESHIVRFFAAIALIGLVKLRSNTDIVV